jgi:hypothetical protein
MARCSERLERLLDSRIDRVLEHPDAAEAITVQIHRPRHIHGVAAQQLYATQDA